jgi:alpha-N-acetylglucosaminidase
LYIILIFHQLFLAISTTPSVHHAISDLIQRIIPTHANLIEPTIKASSYQYDYFELENLPNNRIKISGNNGVSIASGLYWYLKKYCNFHLSWCGNRKKLPSILPELPQKVIIQNPHVYRVYFNYCTFNYSASWWDWKRWEQEIDFMALNGINMPLAVVGVEGIWYNTLLKLGISDENARAFLCGPAYFAWQWMTNIQSHGGPLPKSWIDSHIELGRKIIDRQRSLGMTPIQQGFSGFVPRRFKTLFPEAAIEEEGKWCNFEGTCQLDPLDPIFDKVGRVFLETELEIFGTDHLYAADPFHEGSPPNNSKKYLKNVGNKIFNLFISVDPAARWVMQAWSIRKNIAKAVPKDRLIVLDLNGSKWRLKRKFWGFDFVIGILHNFGGRINLHGDLAKLAKNSFMKVKSRASNSLGMGLFMEGICQNPIYYDLTFDLIWCHEEVVLSSWIKKYLQRRYGNVTVNIINAWQLITTHVYKSGTDGVEKSSIICARPALDIKKSGPNEGFDIPYNNNDLFRAWVLLIKDFHLNTESEGYCYDIIDIGRQVLSNLAQEIYPKVVKAFNQRDETQFQTTSQEFLEILLDVDSLLSSRPEFSFNRWIQSARKHGITTKEKNLYEMNARMLVTLWGPLEDPTIFDYSWREWAGLIKNFYYIRWEKFFNMLKEVLKNKLQYSEKLLPKVYGREAWRANGFYADLAEWETNFVKTTSESIISEINCDISMIHNIKAKYEKYFEKTE